MLRNTASPQAEAGAGPISREDLVAALNELLEAERAGARVAWETLRGMPPGQGATLLQAVHQDEVHWCGMLVRTIQALEGAASSATGAFWGKAMAIADLQERLGFLNRGQGWVVRRLQALIPRVQHAHLQAELLAMLDGHQANMERVDAHTRE